LRKKSLGIDARGLQRDFVLAKGDYLTELDSKPKFGKAGSEMALPSFIRISTKNP
jgi:hypothetical protein